MSKPISSWGMTLANTSSINVCRIILGLLSIKMVSVLINTLRAIICFLGVVGNGAIIFVFSKRTGQAGTGFIIALAVTDLLTSINIPILATVQNEYLESKPYIRYGEVLCQLCSNVELVLISISIWLLVSISLERLR